VSHFFDQCQKLPNYPIPRCERKKKKETLPTHHVVLRVASGCKVMRDVLPQAILRQAVTSIGRGNTSGPLVDQQQDIRSRGFLHWWARSYGLKDGKCMGHIHRAMQPYEIISTVITGQSVAWGPLLNYTHTMNNWMANGLVFPTGIPDRGYQHDKSPTTIVPNCWFGDMFLKCS